MNRLLLVALWCLPVAAAEEQLSPAVQLHARACEKGSAMGCNNLGFAYANGQGAPKDVVRATQLYQRACDAGFALSCTNLGVLLQRRESAP